MDPNNNADASVVFTFSYPSISTSCLFKLNYIKAPPTLGKSGKKICCSCPDTKQARDLCIVQNGEEQCKSLIEAHKACLRDEGFIVK